MTDSWVQFVLGAGLTIASIWSGIQQSQINGLKKDATTGDRDLWSAHNTHVSEYQKFRGDMLRDMVTKQDLRDMERRILNALHPTRAGAGD